MKQITGIMSLRWLTGLLLMFGLMLGTSTLVCAENISFLEGHWDAGQKKVVYDTKSADCTKLDANTDEDLDKSWYFVSGNITYDDDKLEVKAGTVNIVLCDNSKITCKDGIYVPSGHTLNIFSQSFGQGMGAMDAIADENCTAGIGGKDGVACGTINIHGGKIYARGDDNWASSGGGGAGIGGGDGVSGGTICIYGGDITARGATDAAGIGGGDDASAGDITIYGGTINAKGGSKERDGGAGIGGGDNGNGGTITIYGGNVRGDGGPDGAGIGGGDDGAGGKITIHGGDVKGYGGADGAGIGGGDNASAGEITINGGKVDAAGGSNKYSGGAGIGGGDSGSAGTIIINDGTVAGRGGYDAAGIGCGDEGEDGTITINGGNISGNGGYSGAGIGTGNDSSSITIAINNGTVTAVGGELAAGIGTGDRDTKAEGATIDINGGDIEAKGGADGAGIGGGEEVSGGKIKITGGTIRANGGTNIKSGGAGIGGGDMGPGGKINIYGEATIIEAKGGISGAGIGGGDESNGGEITISDGKINALGGNRAAGIGGGAGSRFGSITGHGGTIDIKGGEITATSAGLGAGIGGGIYSGSGTINIYDGTITANGGNGGPGIGAGALCDDNLIDITISGGTVTAHGSEGSVTKKENNIRIVQQGAPGIGVGGLETSIKESEEEEINNRSDFNGTITITGGTVNSDGMGTRRNDALKDGTIYFHGGTVNLKPAPAIANKIDFAENMHIKGILAGDREDKCKSTDSITIEPCTDHAQREYFEKDGKTHTYKCLNCIDSEEHEEEHSYGNPTWVWERTQDTSIVYTKFVCSICGHIEKVDGEVSSVSAQDDKEAAAQADEDVLSDEETRYIGEVTFNGKTWTDIEDQKEYNIDTICENGQIDVVDRAEVGDTVPLIVTPDPHYHILKVSVNGTPIEEQNGNYSFPMPKGDVTVTAELEADNVQVTWINRDYFNYETYEETKEPFDNIEYIEEVPYGTEGTLPDPGEFSALYGKCGLAAWEVKAGDESPVTMQPGEKIVVKDNISITAVWLEHDFTYSAEGAAIKATCSHENCSLPDGEIAIYIVKPTLTTYGETDKGFSPKATLSLDGMDAFEEYADLNAFEEYSADLEEYLRELNLDPAELEELEKELEELEKELEEWINQYIHYYKAIKNDDGTYTKTGNELPAAPTDAGDYVVEFVVPDDETEGAGTLTASVGYTIEKADPSYDVPTDLSIEFGDLLSTVNFSQPSDGVWTWNEPDQSVKKGSNCKAMATFTPNDTANYNIISDIKVPLKVEFTTPSNIADKELVDAAKTAVEAVKKDPTEATVKAAKEALAKISTDAQKAIYGKDLDKDQAAVKAAEQALKEQAATDANKAVPAAKDNKTAKKTPKIKIKTSSKTLKASALKKKARFFKIKYKKTAGSGKVRFKKTGGSKNLTVSKTGKVKVKKGTGKGTYKIKVRINVAANAGYKAKKVRKTIKVKVK